MKMHTSQLEERSDDLSVLFEVGRNFSSTFELEQTLRFAVSTFVNRLDYDRAAVFVVDPENEKSFKLENAAKPGTGKASFDVNWLMDDPSDIVDFLGQSSPAVITDATSFAFSNKALTEYFRKSGYKAFAAIPLISRQQGLGILALGYVTEGKSFTARKLNMLETFGSLIASAIENCRLMDIISGKYRRAGWLSDKIVKAQEEERRRVARNLHDEIGAGLTMLKINLQIARKRADGSDMALRKAADELDHGLGEMISKVRDLTADLRPPILDDLGLAPALTSYIQQFTKRSGLEIGFEDNLSVVERYPDTDIVVYRIVQEALTNVAKHADATKVRVTISEHAGECVLNIVDDGAGFNPKILNDKDLRSTGFGLQNIRQRVDIRGGKFEIKSAPNKGTRLKVRIPWTK
jgi:signal transduction histidine kinase